MHFANALQSPKTSRSSAAGFTLIEVLIVILIISIVTTVAMLTISHNENRQLQTFATELSQIVSLAEEQALLQPQELGINVADNDIEFKSLMRDEKTKTSTWQPLEDQVLKPYAIPSNFQISLEVSGTAVKDDKDHEKDDKPPVPPILISTNGGITPFVMYIGLKGQAPKYAIIADADGNVSSKNLS